MIGGGLFVHWPCSLSMTWSLWSDEVASDRRPRAGFSVNSWLGGGSAKLPSGCRLELPQPLQHFNFISLHDRLAWPFFFLSIFSRLLFETL